MRPLISPKINSLDYQVWRNVRGLLQYRPKPNIIAEINKLNAAGEEADLGMFSMLGRTGAPTKRGPYRPEIVGCQHYIF